MGIVRHGYVTIFPLLLLACSDKGGDTGLGTAPSDDTSEPTDECDPTLDADCDGSLDEDDCDPEDPYSYPGAPEIPYDGADNDCAGDGDLTDVDGDGHEGESVGGDDCNDGNPDIYPGAEEVCYDGIDQDCAGDEDTNDCDGDGHDGRGTEATDCEDEDPTIHPDAEEIWYDGIDQDCTGPYSSDYDADGDGDDHQDYGDGTDCDDQDPLTSGQFFESWDGSDRDCDGEVDSLTTYDADLAIYANSTSYDGWFGKEVVPVEDWDGDGIQDYLTGGPYSGTGKYCSPTGAPFGCEGWVHLLSGGGPDGTPSSTAITTLSGRTAASAKEYGSLLGYDLDSLGDMDGDGLSEILVGAPLHDSSSAYGAGFIYLGSDLAAGGEVAYGSRHARVYGDDYLGLDVAAVGDANGDGLSEIAVGSCDGYLGADSGFSLYVAIWDGADVLAGGDLTTSQAIASVISSSEGGEAVGGADFDGDGFADLILGSDTKGNGDVFVVPGADLRDGNQLQDADYETFMGRSGDSLGVHNGWLEDLDGDGLPELVVGAGLSSGSEDETGAVYVISGADVYSGGFADEVALTTIEGTMAYGRLAPSGETWGDYDGDGLSDLLVSHMGGSAFASITSTVHAISGADIALGGTISADDGMARFPSRMDNDLYGLSAGSWDADGNGLVDVVVGAPANNEVGAVLVFFSEYPTD
jgi:hypothetical protein